MRRPRLLRPARLLLTVCLVLAGSGTATAADDPCRDGGSQGDRWEYYTTEAFTITFDLAADVCTSDLGEITVSMWIQRDGEPKQTKAATCIAREHCHVSHVLEHPPIEFANYYYGYEWRTYGSVVIGGARLRFTQCQSALVVAIC